jgi:hypothetical protein
MHKNRWSFSVAYYGYAMLQDNLLYGIVQSDLLIYKAWRVRQFYEKIYTSKVNFSRVAFIKFYINSLECLDPVLVEKSLSHFLSYSSVLIMLIEQYAYHWGWVPLRPRLQLLPELEGWDRGMVQSLKILGFFVCNILGVF